MESYLDVDTRAASYNTYRQNTTTALGYTSLLTGLAGLTKAGASFVGRKLANSSQNVAKELIQTSQSGSRKIFKANSSVEGAHTLFRRNLNTGKVTHYETYRPQTN